MKYKINLLILFCGVLTVNKIYGQNDSIKSSFEIGINYSPQKSNYNSSILKEGGISTRKSAYGFYLSKGLNNFLNFQTGLTISKQGQKFRTENINYSPVYQSGLGFHNVEFDLSYVKVPVQIKISGNKKNKKRIYLYFALGLQFSFLTSADYTVDSSKKDISKDMKGMTTDIVGNFGLDIRLVENLFFNIKYGFDSSITSAEKESLYTSNGNSSTLSAHNSTSGFIFGISLVF